MMMGLLCVALLALALAAPDADAARRFGGGSSIGKQRQMQPVEPRRAPEAPAAAPQAAPNQPLPTQGGSRWLGPLAGLAAGGLLGALLFGGAFNGIKPMDILAIAALVTAAFFLLRVLRRPEPQSVQYAGPGSAPMADAGAPAPPGPAVPSGFDTAGFLRSAKLSFARLQSANDRKDLADIRDYTTPQMFDEIARHFASRGDAPQRTEVQVLEAELLELVQEGDTAWTSVRFSGRLRDAVSGETETFDEVWHVTKDLADPKAVWLIAGIQQVS